MGENPSYGDNDTYKEVLQMVICELCDRKIKPWFELCSDCYGIKTGSPRILANLMC